MNALRVINTIEKTELYELSAYIGQQVEITIFPISNEHAQPVEDNVETRRQQFFDVIEQCAGIVAPWTREELYAR